MRCRPSARLLVVNERSEVLLFRFSFKEGALAGQTYWATPGGGLDPGETFEQAAMRELLEETGIRVGNVGRSVHEREFVLRLQDGEDVIAQERFFMIETSGAALSREGWTAHEAMVMTQHRWWSIDALALTTDTVWPADLPAIIRRARSAP